MNEPSIARFPDETSAMRRALNLAARGIGSVEPNPPVGAVIVDDKLQPLGEGWHQEYGGPHAEIRALTAAGERARGAHLFITLEPCCHTGKTPPCSRALIEAGIARVTAAVRDPAPYVDGSGIRELEGAGVNVEVGLLGREAALLAAPFLKLVTTGMPFIHAKWAMTLDGKIATRRGQSHWLSNERSREEVHRLRGRMDAIIVGARTAVLDDPRLTARPKGPRTPVRIVVDRDLLLSPDCRLLQTIDEAPVLLATSESTAAERGEVFRQRGAEVLAVAGLPDDPNKLDPEALMRELGRRQMTNVLVEGGGGLLGSLFDGGLIDQVHVYLTPKLVGGSAAVSPLAGLGLESVPRTEQFETQSVSTIAGDVYWQGMLSSPWWSEIEARLLSK